MGQMLHKFSTEELENFGRILWRVRKSHEPYDTNNPAPLDALVDILDMPVRAINLLRTNNIVHIGQLAALTEDDVASSPISAGKRLTNEIREALVKVGRALRTI